MRRPQSKFLLFLILLLTVTTLLFNLPKEFNINYESAKLPIINKQITIHQKLPGFNIESLLSLFKINKSFPFRKGLDLEGGTSVTLKADMSKITAGQRDAALDSAKNVIERRVNFFGVSEPVVQTAKTSSDYRVIVEIPGVTDAQQAVQLIGQTADLQFWEQVASGEAQVKPEEMPLGVTQVLGENAKQTNLTGRDIKAVNISFDQTTGEPQVIVEFTTEGRRKFADITRRNVGKPLGFVLDNVLVDAPNVREAITQGSTAISGGFTVERAKQLQVQLNAGALPVPLTILEQHAVGATLGQSSLEKSLFAGFLGLVVIAIFMISLYGRFGVIATLALILYTLITLTLFRVIPVTLTLAGIAGFILSIGMAVDANILIFERTKEEIKRGRPRDVAIELGFNRAWTSIRDSNVASLITCSVLLYFGTGMIRGFALTLILGVIVSMFSAIVVTRSLLRFFYRI